MKQMGFSGRKLQYLFGGKMYYIGIDIGSTAAKTAVFHKDKFICFFFTAYRMEQCRNRRNHFGEA